MRFIIGLCVFLFGLFLCLMTFAVYKVGDKAGMVVFGAPAFVCLLIGGRMLRKRRGSWREDPATDRQKEFADELGIKYPKGISKGDLSDKISEAKGQRVKRPGRER